MLDGEEVGEDIVVVVEEVPAAEIGRIPTCGVFGGRRRQRETRAEPFCRPYLACFLVPSMLRHSSFEAGILDSRHIYSLWCPGTRRSVWRAKLLSRRPFWPWWIDVSQARGLLN